MKTLRIICIAVSALFFFESHTVVKLSDMSIRANAEASKRVIDNSILSFYTLDRIQLENVVIPMNTVFSATVRLIGARAYVRVSSIIVRDEIYAVDWRVIGGDNMEGLPIIEYSKRFEVYENQRLTFRAFSN